MTVAPVSVCRRQRHPVRAAGSCKPVRMG